jgi:integrase
MGVTKYKASGKTFWKLDESVTMPSGELIRIRRQRIPTKEQALALAAKIRSEAFETGHFGKAREYGLTVEQAWNYYLPVSKRDNRSWQTEAGRASHVLNHLGRKKAAKLTLADIDHYRTKRFSENGARGKPPAPATVDREIEILKRILNYAVKCGRISANPVAGAKLLRKPNVRTTVIDEDTFEKLVDAAAAHLRPILVVAFDTGMRRNEILRLRWNQVDLRSGVIRLEVTDTKTEQARTIVLTKRAQEALRIQPRHMTSEHVFTNPATGKPYTCIKRSFEGACRRLGLKNVWFHDLRRSFVTRARRMGVPESVVMKMSGHKTRAVFDRYNIVSDDDLREAMSMIEAGHRGNLRQNSGNVRIPTPKSKRPPRKYAEALEKK